MTWKPSVAIDDVIALLNEALTLDPLWMSAMVAERKLCNTALAAHPAIQVGRQGEFGVAPGSYAAGLLGLLNGIFGTDEDGWGAIAAVIDERDTGAVPLILRFEWSDATRAAGRQMSKRQQGIAG